MAQNASQQDQDVRTAPTAITAACESIVADYHAGDGTRGEAVNRLGVAIAGAPGGILGNPGALQAHLAFLDEWDRNRASVAAQTGGMGQDDSWTINGSWGDNRDRGSEPQDDEYRHGELHPTFRDLRGIAGCEPDNDPPTPALFVRSGRWNDVDPGDYAWNWRSTGDPLKWTMLEPLMRRTQLLRAVYAKVPKQVVASVLKQYDKPDFPLSLWKTILLKLEKLHGESFTLEATKSDNYSIGEGIELEVKDDGGGAKNIRDFGTWSILWD